MSRFFFFNDTATTEIYTPPRNGTNNPGRVTTMTCKLTFTVECVAERMYQLTPAKFIPLPKTDTNMARKKYREPSYAQMRFQSTRFVCAVSMGRISLLSCAHWDDGLRPSHD